MRSVSPVYSEAEKQFEYEIAKTQPEYIPVIAVPVTLELVDPDTGERRPIPNWAVGIRFRFSDEERALILAGGDIVLTQMLCGQKFQPVNLQVCKPGERPVFEMKQDEPVSKVLEMPQGHGGDARHQCVCGHQRHSGVCGGVRYASDDHCKCDQYTEA